MSDVLPSADEAVLPQSKTQTISRRRQVTYRILGVLFLSLAFLLAFYGTIAGLAWQSGEQIREDSLQAELSDQLTTQLERTESDVANGNYQLALRRLEWVLQREPHNPQALALQQQAEAGLEARLNPTAAPTDVVPTTVPTDTPMPEATFDPSPDYQAIAALIEDEAWPEAIEALITFQTANPSFERRQTDIWLYDAHIAHGLALLNTESVELGLFHLGQAEKLGDLPIEVQDQIGWAELYLTGLAFYGVDWSATVFYFRQLCLAAPFYQNSCGTLRFSLIQYGDLFADQMDYCPAEPFYREAISYGGDAELRERLNEALQGCAEATPTPEAPITDTVPITNTVPISNSAPANERP